MRSEAQSPEADRRNVRRVLDGEVEAFAGLVDRWQGPLVHLAYRFCRDRGIAEELAQDAFLEAYRKLGQWRGEAAFSTWLFALATNVYRSWARRRRLPTVPLEALGWVAEPAKAHAELEESDRERLVREAVLSLPSKYRDALILYYFHEMEVLDAARSLGIAEGTMKSHLHRGRKLLEKRLPGLAEPAAAEQTGESEA